MNDRSSHAAATDAAIEAAARSIAGTRLTASRQRDGVLTLALDATGLDSGARTAIEADLRRALAAPMADAQLTELRIALTASRPARLLIAVGSGKGGVGKSTLSANLAIALARTGAKVGLVDADIYGPSQPTLMAREGVRPESDGAKLLPVASPYGVPLLSMGMLAQPGQAIAWRGPMAGKALEQLIDAAWGDAEVLIVDLPPGTGDIQLSMLQRFRPAGAVIVSTPQDLALIDANRAITLLTDAGVPIIGIVENMAGYQCPHCGESSDPFGNGGAETAAARLGIPFLGRVPLALAIRQASDAGVPPATTDDALAAPYHAIAGAVARWIRDRDGAPAHQPPMKEDADAN